MIDVNPSCDVKARYSVGNPVKNVCLIGDKIDLVHRYDDMAQAKQ
jgi:hypothetical protein